MKALLLAELRASRPFFLVGLGLLIASDLLVLLLADASSLAGGLNASILTVSVIYFWGAIAWVFAGSADRNRGTLSLTLGLPLPGWQLVLVKGLAIFIQLVALALCKLAVVSLIYLRLPVSLMPLPPGAYLLKFLGLLVLSLTFATLGLTGSLLSQPGPRGWRQVAATWLFWPGLALLTLLGDRLYRLLARFDRVDFAPLGLRIGNAEMVFTLFPNTPLTLLVMLLVLLVAYGVASWLYEHWLEV